MDMQFVDSSTIERIGYDPMLATVRVEFKKSGTYDYHGVPSHIFEEFKGAPSLGRYLSVVIKPSYAFVKI